MSQKESVQGSDGAVAAPPLAVSDILTAIGEVVYDWSIRDGTIRWGDNALDVLGVASLDRIASEAGFSGLVDPKSGGSRETIVLASPAADDGRGVPYQVQYALLPDRKSRSRRLWIEDLGRWYAGADGRPERAHGVLRVINERHEREQRLAYLSRYDDLTGYFNRPHLLATLDETIRKAQGDGGSVAFLIVAIDNFGMINEVYGFDIADQINAAVAHRIKSRLRGNDAIGRFSGGKLGLVLMDCSEADMPVAAERFAAAARNEVVVTETGSVAVTVTIGGVALPRHGASAAEAVSHAQEALHLARLKGHGHFVAYTHSPERQALRKKNAAQSSELVAALREDRLALAFQPVVETRTRSLVFHEALVRLDRAESSTVPAADFAAIAERLGLIRLIDRRVLELALDVLAATDNVISVNVSADTVDDRDWLERLKAALARKQALAKRLIVEITETAMIKNLEEASAFVAALHKLGCRVAIDDFGAGFTSFRNLRVLDVDIVKIDGSFIENLPRNPDDQIFVRTLIELARSFGITTIAEWVQDEATMAILAGLGVDAVQGTLTGPPLAGRPGSRAAPA